MRVVVAFAAEDVRMVLEEIEGGGETVFAKPLAIELPDPDDLPFLEVAVAGGADDLVTGNDRHFRPLRGIHRVEIVSPNGLVERVAHS